MREYSLELSKAPSSEEGKKKDKDRKERKESQKERTKHTDGPKDSVSFISVCVTVELAPCMIVLFTRIGKCYCLVANRRLMTSKSMTKEKISLTKKSIDFVTLIR